jgi:hypothetical protein
MSKSSKWRGCPALGRDISTADCGEQRQSHLACPADCAHTPFSPANYSRLLEIERHLDEKTSERMMKLVPDRDALDKKISGATRDGELGLHAFFVWHLFFEKDRAGRTFGRRWEEDGLGGLKNDERILWRGKMQMQIALLEVHRVQGNGRMEAVDLLSPSPSPMIFQDRSLAGMACRFSTILAWIYPSPHFWRLSGAASPIPDVGQFTALEIVREIVGHLGGPVGEKEMRLWLAEHFVRFDKSLRATAHLRRRQMFSAMDAKLGRAVYELRTPFAQCRHCLDEHQMVAPDELSDSESDQGFAEARVWFDESPVGEQFVASGGKPVLGRLLLGQSYWRLEAFGGEKLARLRRHFEEHLDASVRFQGERLDDLGAQINAKGPDVEESLVPSRLLEGPSQIVLTTSRRPVMQDDASPEEIERKMIRETEQAFLNDKVPALNHRTPREAARDPSVRPKLVQMMKERVRICDEENLRNGRADDLNWMLKELNLDELVFDPPPLRPPPAERDLVEPLSATKAEVAGPNRPPPPALPAEPLTYEDAAERYQKAMETFETFVAAENELVASGSTILDDADNLTAELLSDNDFTFAIPFLVHTWFALVPIGCRAPELNFEMLEKTFQSNLRKIGTGLRSGQSKQFEAFIMRGPQPNIVLLLANVLMGAATDAPKEFQASFEAQPVILAMLKSLVEELDAVLRPQ